MNNAELITLAPYKCDGPAGVGVLLRKADVLLSPILYGGAGASRVGARGLHASTPSPAHSGAQVEVVVGPGPLAASAPSSTSGRETVAVRS